MLGRLCAVVVLVASGLIVLTPSGAADAPATLVDLPALAAGPNGQDSSLVVDHAHDQILVGGPGGLDVAAADGSSAAHVASSPTSIGGLALSRDASTLWMSDEKNGTLIAVDAAHVTDPGASHELPQAACPSKIAVDGSDRVWFLFRTCGSDSGGGLGFYDPANGGAFQLAPAVDADIPDLPSLDVLENNPSAPNELAVASDSHTYSVDLDANTVSGGDGAPMGAGSLAMTSDGAHMLRSGPSLQLLPTTDPGSAADAVSFDPGELADQETGPRANALSADDDYAAAVYWPYIVSFGTTPGQQTWVRRCEDAESAAALAWDGPNVWFVRDNTQPMQLGRCDDMTTPQSFMTTPQPIARRAGTTFAAHFTLSYQGAPIADATLTVRRSGAAGAANLGPIVTDANGHATLRQAVAHDENSYTVAFAGDNTHPPYSSVLNVQGTRDDTGFATWGGYLSGRVNHRLTIRNRLLDETDGKGLGLRTIHVVRVDATGRHTLKPTTTGRTGRFALTDTVKVGPKATYYLTYHGEVGYHDARAAKYTVEVTRLKPALAITLKHPAIWYGQKAAVRIHLGPTYRNRSVTLFAEPAERGRRRVFTGAVNRQGNLTASVPMSRNTTFYADFKGDPRYDSREVSATELSGLLPSVRIVGGYATSGKYRLYHSGVDVKQIGKLLPAQTGRCLKFNAAHRSGAKWVEDAASDCVATNRKGVAVAYFHAPQPKLGVAYVFQTYYEADDLHTGSSSAGALAKFTAAGASSRASARMSSKGFWTIGR